MNKLLTLIGKIGTTILGFLTICLGIWMFGHIVSTGIITDGYTTLFFGSIPVGGVACGILMITKTWKEIK